MSLTQEQIVKIRRMLSSLHTPRFKNTPGMNFSQEDRIVQAWGGAVARAAANENKTIDGVLPIPTAIREELLKLDGEMEKRFVLFTEHQFEAARTILTHYHPPYVTSGTFDLENRLLGAYGVVLATRPDRDNITMADFYPIPGDIREELIKLDEEVSAAAQQIMQEAQLGDQVEKVPLSRLKTSPKMSFGKKLAIGAGAAVTAGGLAWGGFRLYRALRG